MNGPCCRCGRPAHHAHHIVGRALDPATVPLCRGCHGGPDGVHARLRGLGYDRPADGLAGLGGLAPVELGLRRLAVYLDFLGLPEVADCLGRLADQLTHVALPSAGFPAPVAGGPAVGKSPTPKSRP